MNSSTLRRAARATLAALLCAGCAAAPAKPPASQPASVEHTRKKRRVVSHTTIEMLVHPRFAPGSSTFDAKYDKGIVGVAKTLEGNPQITLMQLVGSCSPDEAKCPEVSLARARVVMKRLIAKGVAAERLEAKGGGTTGKRIVEFLIAKRISDK